MESRQVRAFELAELMRLHGEGTWAEFLNVRTLRLGVYRLRAGVADPQLPHAEDEVYYVVSGRASLRTNGDLYPVGPGSIVFVPATVPHRFENITEDLVVLVFFAGMVV